MLRAYLSAQPSSLSAFMISKTFLVAQKASLKMQKCVVVKLSLLLFGSVFRSHDQ